MAKADKLIQELTALLPSPVRDEQIEHGVRLIGGDPGEVVADVIGNDIHFSQFAVEWDGPHTPVVRPLPIATVQWKTLLKQERTKAFKLLVDLICKRRRKQYRVCQYCEQLTPPEWLHTDNACQGCAERHLGVVH